MAVDNRNFKIIDIEDDDPEDFLSPEEDDDEETMTTNQTTNPFTPQAPWQQRNYGASPSPTTVWPSSPPRPVWTPPSFGTTSNYYNSQQQRPQTQQYQQSNENRIDRKKKIIFCDLYDVLIESESAVKEQQSSYLSGVNNYKRSGISPRGLYDIRLKTEVWSKLEVFGADYVFCVTNQPEKSHEELKTWKVMTDFVMYALADYLNLPHDNCRCFTKIGFSRDSEDTKPGIGLIKKALSTIPGYNYTRKDLVIIGINSGYQNQSNVDRVMAKKAKIDYVDVNELLVTYY